MTAPRHDSPAPLVLSREEKWVVHAALLAYAERVLDGGGSPDLEETLVEQIETGDKRHGFDRVELDRLTTVLESYLREAPERDAPTVRRVLDAAEDARA